MAKDKPDYLNHRVRLRERFAKSGTDGFLDYEILELYLFNSLPRIDTKPVAKRLIEQFGSFAAVVGASIHQLTEVKGVGPKVAQDIKLLQAAALELGQQQVLALPDIISSWSALVHYCRSAMQFEDREQFRVLFLDKKNRLLLDKVMGHGTVDRAPVYPREVIGMAIKVNATALILAHNHPSGDPTPSQSDIDMTQQIVTAAGAINISVHDHIIIGRNDIASFKTLGLM